MNGSRIEVVRRPRRRPAQLQSKADAQSPRSVFTHQALQRQWFSLCRPIEKEAHARRTAGDLLLLGQQTAFADPQIIVTSEFHHEVPGHHICVV